MQKRFLALIVIVGVGVVIGALWMRRSSDSKLPSPAKVSVAAPAPAAPAPTVPVAPPPERKVIDGATGHTVATVPAATPTPVAIQDNKTLDFSGGKAVVKETPADKAAMDAALKEMNEATKNVTFEPTPAKK